MIEIDGSYGEGGGQIIRTAVALSAVTGLDTKITNIRRNRPNPGLKTQHVKAIEAISRICNADVEGLNLGSQLVCFSPMEMEGASFKIDIQTAGSISLLLQCLMPAAIFSKEKIELTVIGGTDVAWSPTTDYLKHVTLGSLSRMGYQCNMQINSRGYYPRGGGSVKATIFPTKMKSIDYLPDKCTVRGVSHCSNLPEHVPVRQAEAAINMIREHGYEAEVDVFGQGHVSTGSGITLWCPSIGSSALGRKGLPAETVGKNAAKNIITELDSGASVDVHLADQLIPYMGLCRGGSYTTREISEHTRTNIWVTEQFLDVHFTINRVGKLFEVSAD